MTVQQSSVHRPPRADARRLRVLVVAGSDDPAGASEWLPGLAHGTPRLEVTAVVLGEGTGVEPRARAGARSAGPTRSGRAAVTRDLLHHLRDVDPDVVLAVGTGAATALRPAAVLSGHVVVTLEARELAGEGDAHWHRLAGALAVAAGRAGAGVDPRSTPPVSLVVPVWREGALVDVLVDTLLPQMRDGDELVLVDDASPDDTGERVDQAAARHPQVVAVRRTSNGRAGAARNSGVAVARHDRLVFTDAGCHWGAGWLDAMRVAFAEDPAPDLVAGTYRVSRSDVFQAAMAVGCYPDVRDVRRSGPLTTVWSALFGRRFDATRPAGRSVAASRRAVDLVGGWPEGQIAHEDVDLARAVAERGLRCVMTTDADLLWDQAGPRDSWAMYVRYGRGDALASDRQALARDAARAAAYVVGPVGLLAGGPVARVAVALGAALYFCVPLARARHERQPVLTAALVPPVIALKDLAKALGAAQVLLERRRRA